MDAIASLSFAADEKLVVDDGSGELTHDVSLPADRVSEAVVDNGEGLMPSAAETDSADAVSQPRRTLMIPHASVILSQQSSSLRTLFLYFYDNQSISWYEICSLPLYATSSSVV